MSQSQFSDSKRCRYNYCSCRKTHPNSSSRAHPSYRRASRKVSPPNCGLYLFLSFDRQRTRHLPCEPFTLKKTTIVPVLTMTSHNTDIKLQALEIIHYFIWLDLEWHLKNQGIKRINNNKYM